MNKKIFPIALLAFSNVTTAQLGIGTLTPNSSSQLEIISNNK